MDSKTQMATKLATFDSCTLKISVMEGGEETMAEVVELSLLGVNAGV